MRGRNRGLCPRMGKRRYRSRAHARRALRAIHEANAHQGMLDVVAPLRDCYECRFCRDWHLTKQLQGSRQ
jgi:hypothetical protein